MARIVFVSNEPVTNQLCSCLFALRPKLPLRHKSGITPFMALYHIFRTMLERKLLNIFGPDKRVATKVTKPMDPSFGPKKISDQLFFFSADTF